MRLPAGIYFQFTQKLAWPLLFIAIGANIILLKYRSRSEFSKVRKVLLLILLFSGLYILLLPLGGYRIYRPNILRWDTIMPITVLFVSFYGYSALILLRTLQLGLKRIYIGFVIIIAGFYTISDEPNPSDNKCERQQIMKLAESDSEIVRLDSTCTVMAWERVYHYEHSRLAGQLLYHWNVLDRPKLYFQGAE